MKKYLLAILILCVFSSTAFTQTESRILEFFWTYDDTENSLIDGFRIYDADNQLAAEIPDPTARSGEVEFMYTPGTCASFYSTAYSAEEESDISNIAYICFDRRPIKATGQFSVEIK